MRYRLLAIDLDGTMLDSKGCVPDANRDAVLRARDAGVLVVPCTGRGYREAQAVLESLGDLSVGVFNTGGLIIDHPSGATLKSHPMDAQLAWELIGFLRSEPEAVLVYRDFNAVGHDYLVTGDGAINANTRWWFETVQARVAEDRQPTVDALEHTVRVGVVGTEDRMGPLTKRLQQVFAGRVEAHCFTAVQSPDPAETVVILEVFGAGVTKWKGVQWLAEQHGIPVEAVACIGDEVNDLSMLRGAGFSMAMGNAIDAAKQAAGVVLEETNEQAGVAAAIDRYILG